MYNYQPMRLAKSNIPKQNFDKMDTENLVLSVLCTLDNCRLVGADAYIDPWADVGIRPYAWDNIPAHINCGCSAETVSAIVAGTATNNGMNVVDRYLLLFGCLPSCYITKEAFRKAGWKPVLGNLNEILPGMMIGGNIYKNRDHRLPELAGRIWYEADFDYDGGYRNHCRLLYSNDGLVFITYDHYLTFYEITLEVSA